jgi:hypothetical protein
LVAYVLHAKSLHILTRASAVRAVAHEAKLDLVSFSTPTPICSRFYSIFTSAALSYRLFQIDTLASTKKFTASARSVASSLHSSHASAQALLSSVSAAYCFLKRSVVRDPLCSCMMSTISCGPSS